MCHAISSSPDKVSTGAYDMVNSAGPMLTFSTYNEIFHFFSEPSNALGIGEDGMGMRETVTFLSCPVPLTKWC